MSARPHAKGLVIAGVAALATGCLFGDLSGLAGPPLADDGGLFEGLDGQTTDGMSSDGSREAETGGPTRTSPCSGMHDFCADFDGTSVDRGFTKIIETGPGTLDQGNLSLSAPHSLHATSPRKSAPSGWFQVVDKFFNSGWRRTRLQGDIYLMPMDWQTGDANIAFANIVMLSSSGNTGTVWFQASDGAATTIENPDPTKTSAMDIPLTPPGRWVHMMMDYDPGGHLHVELDGKKFDRDFAGFTAGNNPAIEIQLGLVSYNHPVPAMDVHWDNVTVDFP